MTSIPLRKVFPGILSLLVLVLSTHPRSADQTLIAAGSFWKYNDSGSNLGTAWRGSAYNDATWPTGAAQLGYGDGDEATILSYGSNPNNRRITYYFRRSVSVANPASIAALVVRFVRDDGCVIYLNGVEVVRSNMPSGTVTYTTRATAAIGGADESAWQQANIDPSRLVAGTNIIAVEVHQQSPTSSDVSFDLELTATEAQVPAPIISLVSPVNHAVSNTSAVSFSASVSAAAGLASATLYMGGAPTTTTFSGPSQVEDAQLTADTPTIADGANPSINVDGQTPHAHGVLKVPALVGAGAGQVPAGAIVTSAVLLLNCTNSGMTMYAYRLTQSWVESEATWNERSAGVPWTSPGADGAGSNAGVALPADCTTTGQRQVDITTFVQEWSNGAPNYGLVLVDSGTDGVDLSSSESGASPTLAVTFRNSQQAIETKTLSGTSATVSFSTSLAMGQTYAWNVQAVDVSGRQGWAPSDFDVTVDASAPDEPVLVSPPDGSTGVTLPAVLSARVSDPAGGTLTASASLRRASAAEFTIIALPDTQHYSEQFPAVFTAQTQWIIDNKTARNIVFVTHEGDIVEHYNLASEWQAANTSLSMLDGVVPYGMGPGNHDQPTTLFNQYFPYTRYQGETWYGGHYQNLNDNNYELFSGGGMDFVIVHLQFCPPAAAVSWASSVLQTYPDRIGMMTTHGYLGLSAQRSVNLCADTQYLWDGLAVPNPNLHFMLAGHVHGESRRVDTANGHPVYQMLADYQDRATGGEGWLRILRFVPSEDKVYVQTYSPWLNRFESDADSEFTLDFPMSGGFADAGSVPASSGSIASITPAGLLPFTAYEWRMSVTNAGGKTRTGPVWTFMTGADGTINHAPTASGQSLTVSEDAVATAVALAAIDPDGDPLGYSIVAGPAHGTLTGTAPAVMYQPAANYNGADSFTFRASDGQANSNPATVSLTIQPVNDAPSGAGESYTIQSGAVLTIAAPGVLANDSDIDSSALTAQLALPPAHGALTLNTNGSFTYTPSAGYSGPDPFGYVVNDGLADSGMATAAITVTAAPLPTCSLSVVPSSIVAGGTATLSWTTQNTASLSIDQGIGPVTPVTSGSLPVSPANTTTYTAGVSGAGGSGGCSTVLTVTSPSPGPTGLIAAYEFSAGTGTAIADSSGNNLAGTATSATWTTAGKYGNALSFNGTSSYVNLANPAALQGTGSMTWTAWVKATGTPADDGQIVSKSSGSNGWQFKTSPDTGPHTFGILITGSSGIVQRYSTTVRTLDTWYHVAAVYDAAARTLDIYVDGVLDNGVLVGTIPSIRTVPTTSVNIGRRSGGFYFAGILDDVRIYGRALTPGEIQTVMTTPVP
jgi:hypothetical protein